MAAGVTLKEVTVAAGVAPVPMLTKLLEEEPQADNSTAPNVKMAAFSHGAHGVGRIELKSLSVSMLSVQQVEPSGRCATAHCAACNIVLRANAQQCFL